MTEVTPARPSQPKLKRRSIKTKILLALLALALLPLILFVAISHPGINYVQEHIRSELIRESQKNLVRLAEDQATIVSAKLDKVADETRTAALLVQALLRDASAFGGAGPHSVAEKPDNLVGASSYILSTVAPGVSLADAKPALGLSGNLEKVFAFLKEGDPSLEQIWYGSQSGVYLEYPGHSETSDFFAFNFKPTFAQYLNAEGEIPEPLWVAFRENGLVLSRHAVVSTTEPGNRWLIRDDEKNWLFSEPLAKFIERGEFSLCSRGGGAGAQAGAGLSCVTRSI